MSDSTEVTTTTPESDGAAPTNDVGAEAPQTSKAPRTNPFVRFFRWLRTGNPFLVTFYAFLLGLVVGALVIIFTTPVILNAWRDMFSSWNAPFHAINVTWNNVGAAYRALFTGSIVDPPQLWHSITTGNDWSTTLTPLSETLTYATPLAIASIGVAIGFQTGVFNIGANGQAIMGAIFAVAVGSMIHCQTWIHIPLTIVAGILGGIVAGLIPGILKAFTGAHEVITTIMLNSIINLFLGYLLLNTALEQPGTSNGVSRTMDPSAQLGPIFGSALRVNWGLVIAGVVVVGALWFLNRSTLGFDFRMVGANPNAARTAGVSSKFIVVAVFAVSGGLCGLAGMTQASGVQPTLDINFLQGAAGIGFTAITVALLGRNKPVGVMLGALLFAALGVGGRNMQATVQIPLDLATVIQATIVLFVATPALVSVIFRLKNRSIKGVELASKGWS